MMLIVFRSRLTAAAGSDYWAMSQAIKEHVSAKNRGRAKYLEVAEIVMTSQFQRQAQTTA